MEKYDSYKNSGVDWIGEIPSHWNTGKLGFYSTIVRGCGYQLLNEVNDDSTSEMEKVIRINDFNYFNPKSFEYSEKLEKYRVIKNDILIGGTGSFGVSMIVTDDIKGFVHSYNVLRVRNNHHNPKYIQFLISSDTVQTQMKLSVLGSIQSFVDIQGLKDLILTYPSIDEQQQIVSFLDTKTSLIDSLIEKTQRKIELLKEKRTSLINEVVTKGLNPNVEMKDSGVEWIGDIPSHWFCVGTNKVYNDLGTGTTPTSDNSEYYSDNGYHWITTTDLNEGIMLDTLSKITEKSVEDYPNLRLYPSGSIYISMYGGRIGKLGVSTFDSYCNQSVCVLPKNDTIIVKFYYYWFLGFQEFVKGMGRGGGQPNINKDMIQSFPTVKIPLSEQKQIVDYLDEQTQLIDKTISIEEKRIELLKEYRQSLISEVVTGKRKVVE